MPRLAPFIALALLLSAGSARAASVWIDAGHGGAKAGAPGPKQRMEKEITLELAKRLKAELEKAGARVGLSRDSDVEVGLQERMRRANATDPDLFISIHCNSMPLNSPSRKTARGVETYFLSADASGEQAERVAALENAEAGAAAESADPVENILNDLAQTQAHRDASALAYAIHQQLVKDLGVPNRGVHQAPFLVLMGAKMPAILVEVGFLSHLTEGPKLAEPAYQKKIVASLAAGIRAFLAGRAGQSEPPKTSAKP